MANGNRTCSHWFTIGSCFPFLLSVSGAQYSVCFCFASETSFKCGLPRTTLFNAVASYTNSHRLVATCVCYPPLRVRCLGSPVKLVCSKYWSAAIARRNPHHSTVESRRMTKAHMCWMLKLWVLLDCLLSIFAIRSVDLALPASFSTNGIRKIDIRNVHLVVINFALKRSLCLFSLCTVRTSSLFLLPLPLLNECWTGFSSYLLA